MVSKGGVGRGRKASLAEVATRSVQGFFPSSVVKTGRDCLLSFINLFKVLLLFEGVVYSYKDEK